MAPLLNRPVVAIILFLSLPALLKEPTWLLFFEDSIIFVNLYAACVPSFSKNGKALKKNVFLYFFFLWSLKKNLKEVDGRQFLPPISPKTENIGNFYLPFVFFLQKLAFF